MRDLFVCPFLFNHLPIGFLSNQPTSGKRTLLMVEHPSKNMIEDHHSNISDCNHENTQKRFDNETISVTKTLLIFKHVAND